MKKEKKIRHNSSSKHIERLSLAMVILFPIGILLSLVTIVNENLISFIVDIYAWDFAYAGVAIGFCVAILGLPLGILCKDLNKYVPKLKNLPFMILFFSFASASIILSALTVVFFFQNNYIYLYIGGCMIGAGLLVWILSVIVFAMLVWQNKGKKKSKIKTKK